MRYRTTILTARKTATGIEVPDDVLAALGSARRPAVRATINGYTYRSTVGSVDGRAMLSISAEVRAAAGVAAGDEIEVELEVDTEPREVAVPGDLADALRADPEAKDFFEQLSYSHQSAYVTWIESAKKDETRRKRIPEAVEMLRSGRRQR
jgi:hypothetical protein